MVVARGWGEREMELLFDGYRALVLQDQNSPRNEMLVMVSQPPECN